MTKQRRDIKKMRIFEFRNRIRIFGTNTNIRIFEYPLTSLLYIAKTKALISDQLHGYHAAYLRLCFRIYKCLLIKQPLEIFSEI